MVYFLAEHILTTDSQQMSQKRIMQCLNGCWQISFSHHHPLQYGNSRSMSACVSVFRLPAWAGCGQSYDSSRMEGLLALQPCRRGGFTGSQWSSKSRVGMGTDECALGGCDQQRVLAKSWYINLMFCWAVAGRESPAQVLMVTLTTSVFFWWERLEVIFNVTVCCDRTDPTWGSSLHSHKTSSSISLILSTCFLIIFINEYKIPTVTYMKF